MRRWNGWGDENTIFPFPTSAAHYLEGLVGPGQPEADSSLEHALTNVPSSRLPENPLVTTAPYDRLLHACGQSLPDWIAMRGGCIAAYPDGVAYPQNTEQVSALLQFARQTGACIIPYGGGTSVVGHINPLPAGSATLTVDLSQLNHLIQLDETNRLATFEAGVNGPELEAQLNRGGYTLGHFPQSFELSTLGGWIATRSSGQQSYYYGRIEDLFAGGHVETPRGPLDFPTLPASAAGPDLRQLFLGSEGRLGLLTQATLRIRRLPEVERFYGVFFHDWASGAEAVRAIAQERVPVSMARLSDAQETETTLALSGKDALVSWAGRGLEQLGYHAERALLIFGVTGSSRVTRQAYRQAVAILRAHKGLTTGEIIGRQWRKSRFLTPYLRNTLWERGYALDTLETAIPWTHLMETAQTVKHSLQYGLDIWGERVLVFAHLSHIYRDGASLYVTYLFRRTSDPQETLARWQALKTAASRQIVAQGGTISHQHGVGRDHAAYLPAEKGRLGMHLIASAAQCVDPEGLLNPGKLFSS